MTSIQKTAFVVIVTVISAATAPIRAAEDVRVEPTAEVESDAGSTTVGVSVKVEAGDGVPLAAADLTPSQLSIGQLQPTRLKPVSRKKAIIIVAVVVAAAGLVTYLIAVAGFNPVVSSRDEAAGIPAHANHPHAATRR